MGALKFILSFLLLSSGGFAIPASESEIQGAEKEVYKLQLRGTANLALHVEKNGCFSNKCTLQNVAVRKEWSTLSRKEKLNYINAVKCLAKKAPRTPASLETGVRSRYDDYILTHMNQSFSIHATGNFFAWHRYFTWSYEKALREECGYQGYQPYMDWGRYAHDPLHSPIFDGSDTSLSGDGSYVKHDPVGIPTNDAPQMLLPTAQGGGCLTSGPFKDFKVNLGPCFASLKYIEPNPRPDCWGYNPRCIRRDVSAYTASRGTTDADVAAVITQYPDPAAFMYRFNGDFVAGYLGPHTAGHFTWGGDPGGDFMVSPGDPVFYLHHANVDRVWWIWQNQDVARRTYSTGGTITILNTPPSRNATLEDTVDLGVNEGSRTLRELASTIGGPLCYIYV